MRPSKEQGVKDMTSTEATHIIVSACYAERELYCSALAARLTEEQFQMINDAIDLGNNSGGIGLSASLLYSYNLFSLPVKSGVVVDSQEEVDTILAEIQAVLEENLPDNGLSDPDCDDE
jgi:hypothetical protein